jgi:hypothetical protein
MERDTVIKYCSGMTVDQLKWSYTWWTNNKCRGPIILMGNLSWRRYESGVVGLDPLIVQRVLKG